jgi:hypothetical protein
VGQAVSRKGAKEDAKTPGLRVFASSFAPLREIRVPSS